MTYIPVLLSAKIVVDSSALRITILSVVMFFCKSKTRLMPLYLEKSLVIIFYLLIITVIKS